MKINLKQLKLRARTSEEFRFKEKGRNSSLGVQGAKFLEPIEVEFTVENTSRIFTGHGTVSTLLQLPCSRCLKDFAYQVNTQLNINMVEDIYSDKSSEDDDIIIFSNDEVDILDFVEQAVFVAIPLNPLCKQDCQGLCMICGTDRNTDYCSCHNEVTDPRWDKLKNLR